MKRILREGKYIIRKVEDVIKIFNDTHASAIVMDEEGFKTINIKWCHHGNKGKTGTPLTDEMVLVTFIGGDLEIKYASGMKITSRDVSKVMIEIEK